MSDFLCPYLKSRVELTDERAKHIASSHPDFLPEHQDKIPLVLNDPDQIRRSKRFQNARLFTRWFDDIRGGKFVVVVVVSEILPKHGTGLLLATSLEKLAKEKSNGSEIKIYV